jgi:hypothetical protein
MPNTNHYVGYKYDFTYFVGHKIYYILMKLKTWYKYSILDEDELKKLKKVEIFSPIQRYSLKGW